jgi:hypothetical protein
MSKFVLNVITGIVENGSMIKDCSMLHALSASLLYFSVNLKNQDVIIFLASLNLL